MQMRLYREQRLSSLPKPHVAILEVDFFSSPVPQENCFSRNLDSTSFCLEGKNRLHIFYQNVYRNELGYRDGV